MERISITPRENWIKKIEEQGFLFYNLDNYYDEKAAYQFTANEVDQLEKATTEIWDMCLEAVEHVIQKKLWDRFFIHRYYADFITQSWKEDHCSFYGRLDLGYNDGVIKLLEFNADTPTGLLEASVIQWYWLQDYNASFDQFNSIHEKLVAHLKTCKTYFPNNQLYFSSVRDYVEDYMTVKYIEDCAQQGGITTDFLYIDEISVDNNSRFCNKEGQPIDSLFKLYPWEWLLNEDFGQYLPVKVNSHMNWVEPPWKAILSNKMLLVLLHELFPHSPYILPAAFNAPLNSTYVKKPVFSREGANISIVKNDVIAEQTTGDYGQEGFIYQDYFELPNINNNIPIIGSWLIGGRSAGMGIRESSGLITDNTSRFVPHYFIK
jgi:glutathionylspermidine synthase